MNALTRALVWLTTMLLAASAAGQVSTVTVGSAEGVAGETGIVIPVSLTANGDNIAGIDMTVSFSTASQYASLAADCSTQTVSENIYASCFVSDNVVTIRLAETSGQAWVSGLLANITVNVDAAAVPMLNDPLVALIAGAGDNAGRDTSYPISESGAFTVALNPCNVNTVSGVTEYSFAIHEACESLVLGPDFTAADGSTVVVSSGWEIEFVSGFNVETGATLETAVCGQSLCMTSPDPMPYGCHTCVDQICDIDPSCCALEFDQECLDRVSTTCGLVCE